jgi:hypothetical protein
MQRVLVIDDDAELCELLAQYLKAEGFDLEAVTSGEQDVPRALSGAHALVVLDVMLPGMQGLGVRPQIRAQSHIPVLMLTARGCVGIFYASRAGEGNHSCRLIVQVRGINPRTYQCTYLHAEAARGQASYHCWRLPHDFPQDRKSPGQGLAGRRSTPVRPPVRQKSGKAVTSHPPPIALISSTLASIRRRRMSTALRSLASAPVRAVMTCR